MPAYYWLCKKKPYRHVTKTRLNKIIMNTKKTIGIMAFLSAMGALAGVITSIIMANYFGTSRELEVYFAAISLLTVISSMSQANALGDIFLPQYHQLASELGKEQARRAFSVLINWMVLVLMLLILIIFHALPFIVNLFFPGFEQEDKAMGVDMIRWLLPNLLIITMVQLFRMLLNAESIFGRAEGLATISRIGSLIATIILVPIYGIWALVVVFWIGQLIHIVGYLVILQKENYQHHLILRHEKFNVSALFKKTFFTFGLVSATQIYRLIFNAALTMLPQGYFAIYNYAQQITGQVNALLLRPISTVFFTQCSKAIAAGASSIRKLADEALALMLLITSSLIVLALTSAENIFIGLWGGESFAEAEIAVAAMVIKFKLFLVLIIGLGSMLRKVTLASGYTNSYFTIAIIVRLICTAIAWPLITKFGFNGLLLAMFLTSALTNAGFGLPLFIWKRDFFIFYNIKLLTKWFAVIVIGYMAGDILCDYIYLSDADRIESFAIGTIVGMLSLLLALCSAWVLNIKEVRLLFSRLKGLLPI